QKHERVMASPRDNVTYMNLFELADRSLAIFFRGINFDPSFVTSNDCGKTWSEPIHFFQSEVGGRHRPYARYTGGDDGTVHVAITDAHPRDYGNSIYYFRFRDGQFFAADNTPIKSLAEDGPLRPSETERVYQGTGAPGRGPMLSAEGAAWTSSIAIDKQGHPHIGYTVYRSNQDQRYRIASFNGEQWIDREVAFGGKCLYDREASYTGLITLDPVDPTFVVISTDVDPSTGKDLNGQHEIYRAQVSPTDNVETIQWTAITHDSPVKNIRPVILSDEKRRVILWNRGDFQTYTDYQLDTVGLIEMK
ncbi:MAG: BNR-4 repeat-containing protein, partial [Rhodopirellula sp. JB044]|uniref:BNR-4 repeat-containing protein n=1 Tax=Rhodopirellula sp. JB044 TaxID=3342844 RepID=UPI00370AAC26